MLDINVDTLYAPSPDIHRVYPHTRTFAGAALHSLKWRLVGVEDRAVVSYRIALQKILAK